MFVMNMGLMLFVIISIVYAIAHGGWSIVPGCMLEAANSGIALVITLCGICAVYNGFLNVLRQIGWLDALQKILHPIIYRLFPYIREYPDARAPIAANIAANMLGMGNAATPAGLAAVKAMAAIPGASRDIAMFLVINCSSVQLIPMTVIALRAQAGSAAPADIILPTLAASAVSMAVGVMTLKLCQRLPRKSG